MAERRFAAALVVAFTAILGLTSVSAHAQQVVTPGAFCSPQGATGVTSAATPMVCTTTADDPDQPRWRRAGTTPTTAAPANPPPSSQPVAGLVQPPLAQTASGCHPAYTGACVPNVTCDVDCFRTANGPVYVDDRNFRVVGPDRYGLDADDDAIACESDGTDLAAATGTGAEGGGTATGVGRTGSQRALARTGGSADRLPVLAMTLVSFGAALVLGVTGLRRHRPWTR